MANKAKPNKAKLASVFFIILILWSKPLIAYDNSAPNCNRAIVLDPFNFDFNNQFDYDFFIRLLIYTLEQSDYIVDYYKDGNVTIDLLKKLDDEGYHVIYINTHGSTDHLGRIIIFTGEWASSEKEEIYREDIMEDRVGFENHDNFRYFYVTPKFFAFYGSDNLYNDALIFIDACYSGNNVSLAEVFLNLGASYFIGWNGSVSVFHGIVMDGLFFDILCSKRKTVAEAARAVRPDPATGAKLVYFGQQPDDVKDEGNMGSTFFISVMLITATALIVGCKVVQAFKNHRKMATSSDARQT